MNPVVRRIVDGAALTAAFALMIMPIRAEAFPFKFSIDRKFPAGTFCPIETRDGLLASFQAPANGEVRLTFAAENFIDDSVNPGARIYNSPAVDNVLVIPLAQWNASTSSCIDCFIDPDGDGSEANAPSFPSDAPTLAGLPFAETFDAAGSVAGWSGGSWTSAQNAPVGDASGNSCSPDPATGGSLLLGQESDGDLEVSSSIVIDGLTPGAEYVVFGWFYSATTNYCFGTSCWASVDILLEETGIVSTQSSSFGSIKARFDGQE